MATEMPGYDNLDLDCEDEITLVGADADEPIPFSLTSPEPVAGEPGVMLTRSGRLIHVPTMTSKDVDPIDLMAALHINRWTGHMGDWSVADHSALVGRIMADHNLGRDRLGLVGLGDVIGFGAEFIGDDCDYNVSVAGLIHDLHEVYVGDLASPIKAYCPDFRSIERIAEAAVRGAAMRNFGVHAPSVIERSFEIVCGVHTADMLAAQFEAFLLAGFRRPLIPGHLYSRIEFYDGALRHVVFGGVRYGINRVTEDQWCMALTKVFQ